MSNDIYEALSRTSLLIASDIFDQHADQRRIVDGLRATTARVIADRANVDSVAGQTALVTLCAQLAMMGLQIDLDVPDVDLLAPQPPLRGTKLVSAIVDYAADLLPGGSLRPLGEPDVVFVLGSAHAPDGSVRVSGSQWSAAAGAQSPAVQWKGTGSVGAMAAAAAAAPEGLRAAIPGIAQRLDRAVPADDRWLQRPRRQVDLDLTRYRIDGPVHLGDVDAISGGAITNAALFALLRTPNVSANVRVIEPDRLAISNLNRYALARRSMLNGLKVDALEGFSTPSVRIFGRELRLDDDTVAQLVPIAPRVLIGVDHIPSRWVSQRAAESRWTCVGASSHDYVLVSTHPPLKACAGCVHPMDDNFAGEIPTISFVSFWAGLLQALELLAEANGHSPSWARSTHVWPLGLENPRGIHPFAQVPVAACPVRCHASSKLLPVPA